MGRRPRTSSQDHGHGHDGGGALRWVLTYADMITLLLALFSMMYSMSILNFNRFHQVAVSIRGGFKGPDAQARSVVGPDGKVRVTVRENLGVRTGVVKKIEKLVRENGLEKAVRLRTDERGLVISLVTDKVVFAKGQADLSPGAGRIIDTVVLPLKRVSNRIMVEGHTCDLPVSSDKYPSNWELSTARATTVIRHMIEDLGFETDRMSAAGYSDSKPLVPNTSEANRALNRRVDIIVLKTTSTGSGR